MCRLSTEAHHPWASRGMSLSSPEGMASSPRDSARRHSLAAFDRSATRDVHADVASALLTLRHDAPAAKQTTRDSHRFHPRQALTFHVLAREIDDLLTRQQPPSHGRIVTLVNETVALSALRRWLGHLRRRGRRDPRSRSATCEWTGRGLIALLIEIKLIAVTINQRLSR
jgi:hypothetical protein